ncbi:MAG: hypothetical protein ACI4TX_00580, partial [Christensenellales bacterium]
IVPRGFAGGYTASLDKDESALYTKNQLNAIIAQTMGGRIAEFLQFKDVSVGAENDIRQATEIARKMVTDWGMSDKLGFIAYNNENDMFDQRRTGKSIQFSEQITSEIDNEVRNIINENYTKALNLLQENKHLLDEMAKLLMERETIYSYEVDELMSGKTADEVLKEIEEKENEKKRQQKINSLIDKFKQAQTQKESKLRGLDYMIKSNAINEEQVQEFNKVVIEEYEKNIEEIKTECVENNLDYAYIYEEATNLNMQQVKENSSTETVSNVEEDKNVTNSESDAVSSNETDNNNDNNNDTTDNNGDSSTENK